MAKSEHVVVVVIGLGDQETRHKVLTCHWPWFGLIPDIYSMNWSNGEIFERKLERLIRHFDSLKKKFERVSIVGTSAGGSAALNLAIERQNEIHSAASLCGRLEMGTNDGIRGFDKRTATSRSFRESILYFEQNRHQLNEETRRRIITTHPFFGDELVPKNTATLEGAHNLTVPWGEHVMTIGVSLIVYPFLLKYCNL